MGLMFNKVHPSSISDLDITEKKLMWLAGFRKKNIKGFAIQYSPSIKDVFKKAKAEK